MNEKNEERHHIAQEELFFDEPAYGYHPLQAFRASYTLKGQTFPVVIQGFVKKGSTPRVIFRYRVTYENGNKKILEYVLGTGFIEEGSVQTDHARKLAACINKHFSKG